jgi:hypothetical protein
MRLFSIYFHKAGSHWSKGSHWTEKEPLFPLWIGGSRKGLRT